MVGVKQRASLGYRIATVGVDGASDTLLPNLDGLINDVIRKSLVEDRKGFW